MNCSSFMEKNSKIYIAGINGMVGSAIKRQTAIRRVYERRGTLIQKSWTSPISPR